MALSEVMQNQSNSLITFDTQLKTALSWGRNGLPLKEWNFNETKFAKNDNDDNNN